MSSAVAANWSGNAWHGVLLRGTIRMVPHGVILRGNYVIYFSESFQEPG